MLERGLDHLAGLPAPKHPTQRERELDRDAGPLRRVRRERERLAERGVIVGHRQQRLGAPELEQDVEADITVGRLCERAAQVGHGRLGRAPSERLARGEPERLDRPRVAERRREQEVDRDAVGGRAVGGEQMSGLAMERRASRRGQLRGDRLADDRVHERQSVLH